MMSLPLRTPLAIRTQPKKHNRVIPRPKYGERRYSNLRTLFLLRNSAIPYASSRSVFVPPFSATGRLQDVVIYAVAKHASKKRLIISLTLALFDHSVLRRHKSSSGHILRTLRVRSA